MDASVGRIVTFAVKTDELLEHQINDFGVVDAVAAHEFATKQAHEKGASLFLGFPIHGYQMQ